MLNGGCVAKNEGKIDAICDAGPIIHLDELDSIDLLSDFHSLIISNAVQVEIIKHRPKALQNEAPTFKIIDIPSSPEPRLLILSKTLLLDKGEMESLSLMQENSEAIFLTDDSAARLVAEELGYRVHGTIGIISRAIRKKTRTPNEVIKLLKEIPERSTLFIRPVLLEEIIQKVEKEYL